MKIKDYLIAVGTAAAGALAITLFIGLLALIGWPVVWGCSGYCIPPQGLLLGS